MPLAAWLRATIVGPFLSVSVLVTSLTLLSPVAEGQSRFWTWLQSMAYGGILAFVSAGALIVADLMLFKSNQRKLPTDRRAFWTGIGMPVACVVIYQVVQPEADYGPSWFAALILPALALAGLARWTFGEPMTAPAE